MSKNKKQVAKGAGKTKGADDDDWEAVLAAEAAVNATLAPQVVAPAETAKGPAQVTEESDDDDEEEDGKEAGGAKKDKKKKKKKGGKKDTEEVKKAAVPLTAAGKAILERQRLIAEEEARIKKLNEEEEERIRLLEEAEERERKAIEDEKERKRKQKADKLAKQKEEGTYMTKAEKEKAKKAALRLEQMREAGLLPQAIADPSAATSAEKKSGNEKKHTPAAAKKEVEEVEEVSEKLSQAAIAPAAVEIELPDEWDADDGDGEDSWETNIIAKVGTLKDTVFVDNVEDTLEIDKKRHQEELRVLGIERARREEEARLKREEEEKAREEMERKELEAVVRKETSRKNRTARDNAARAARVPTNLRSPISCIMGHVDTGKTKLLDKIRHTNVQEGEAGGITQQIGATQFSRETLMAQTQSMQATQPFTINLPGLLVIDTPGHESFTNLRSRGSSLCDIAILVIDLMHGLEPQTIESINLLKRKRTPFVVALNKVDRCYGWKTMPDSPFRVALAAQDENTQLEFKDRAERAMVQLMELGLNAKLYWENDDLGHTISLVPTSAVSGEGVPDLLKMVITLTQERLQEQIMYMEVLQCTVLEVKVIEGLGHTVDVVLVNGTLREGDTIVVSTLDGPVVTNIRALLTPPPNREMRIKSEYVHHQVLSGAIGIKIVAPDIGRAIAGTPIMVVNAEDDLEDVKEDVQSDIAKVMKSLQTDNRGVTVHASTLGALEALLQFLREECKPPIPVSQISIGPIHKKDVMRTNIMNEKKLPEFATILAFDVTVDAEAKEMADECNVRIFTAEIIYHLFDQFSAYMNGLNEAKKQAAMGVVVFPCMLKILPQHIFNKKDPIVIGVEVIEGTLRVGTPLCIPSLGLDVGKVTRIENNHKEVNTAKKSTQVSIRIENGSNPTLMYGRQFDDKNTLYSKISRASIDACKEYFKDEMTKDDWNLIIKLKKVFNIS